MTDQATIRDKIDQLKWWDRNRQPGFTITFDSIYGYKTFYGRALAEPIPGHIIFDAWDRGGFGTTDLIPVYEIRELWTEDDECSSCGERGVDLDTLSSFDEPVCQLCAQEAWEIERAEGMVEDAGVGL